MPIDRPGRRQPQLEVGGATLRQAQALRLEAEGRKQLETRHFKTTRKRGETETFWIADCGFKKNKKWDAGNEDRGWKSEERRKGFSCGSGFQPRPYDFNGLNEFNDFSGFNDLPLTAY